MAGRLSSTLRRFRHRSLRRVGQGCYAWHATRGTYSAFDMTMKWQGREMRSVSLNGRVPVST